MAKYLLIYHGGGGGENMSPEEGAKVMQQWTDWFASLGEGVADGGNPISRAWTVTADGTTEDAGANPATGYSVLSAESMDAALVMAKGCPHLAAGGSIELCETFEIG
ncbi:MAG TPA: hypothetical protein PKA49_05740 [Tepidiformaceae bacterium]|nr:hypothetical protein [Thermoflexaceae bacterium]HMS58340.1 hypothetical protein [Tepidiformaceae bacterium]